MKIALVCLGLLVLLAGCDFADKPAENEPAALKDTTSTALPAGTTKKSSVSPGAKADVGTDMIQADAKLEKDTATAEVQLKDTVVTAELTTGSEGSEVKTGVKAPVDTKTFKRFTPDAAEIARKTAAHKDAKGPGLTSTYRRVRQPAAD